MPFKIRDYIASFSVRFPFLPSAIEPWKVTMELPHLVEQFASSLEPVRIPEDSWHLRP
jgi:hypothetical protein